ncbi:hypothetical protein FOXG_18187 [Fusarium oxysporum f. sp. lycopersici 4287]|uniref:Uncharacterized protein n=2 Tax=Fusarium oxysporum TaxID=5507 RepID=A0A0J9UF70_FUSO4|nr:hypothetical protein FOXG_18187 [Fusarium oxysporum f. sp. lycopersici 4287]XP_018234772.1 hypothetical protein FOXG_18187 [Fusarium oxysporum f. sp. lycopersici 4287]EXK42295.1 hypothetical protein FOMG_05309 [Fusarium oxysporum f. sp. melonis 26406]EXK42296.1 hypothetical protein FOMG_05309 [Fusarium oxysporum f. sp. melonis 26406]KNA96725.1 hypothetical protein FOXG_18187 [Fusarium oxysporum f. sp. lycopersici 4287]KNA96726.1 hypothetical protein FOXG_18187 [Fusarium oxysporum f. sp. lyc
MESLCHSTQPASSSQLRSEIWSRRRETSPRGSDTSLARDARFLRRSRSSSRSNNQRNCRAGTHNEVTDGCLFEAEAQGLRKQTKDNNNCSAWTWLVQNRR